MAAEEYVFLDIETTGLAQYDRIVSLGMITIPKPDFSMTELAVKADYFIFDPRRDSAPTALAIHGYDDWLLRHQPLFEDHADYISTKLANASLIAAHNAIFDASFLGREFRKCGIEFDETRINCTLRGYRSQHQGPANLDFICQRFGLDVRGQRHGALADAYRCMLVYLWLIGFKFPDVAVPQDLLDLQPENIVFAPPHPGEPLPRRKPKRRKSVQISPLQGPEEVPMPVPITPEEVIHSLDNQRATALLDDAIQNQKAATLKPPQPPPTKSVAQKIALFFRRILNIH